MGRYLIALFFLTACPAYAETFVATAKITHVTVYPQGATIEREVTIDLPAGTHDLLIPGFPFWDTDGKSFRVVASDGVTVVGQSEFYGPLPPDATYADLNKANETVAADEAKLRSAIAGIAAIRVRAEAARAKVEALEAMASADNLPATAEGRKAIVDMIEQESLIALQAIQVAEADAVEAGPAKDELQKTLDASVANRDALLASIDKDKTLSLTLDSAGGEATIQVSSFSSQGSWWPVYDIKLTIDPEVSLSINRNIEIKQDSKDVWRDVTLTVSTLEANHRTWWSNDYPLAYGLVPEPEVEQDASSDGEHGDLVAPPDNVMLQAGLHGVRVEVTFPQKVTISGDQPALRLAVDHMDMSAELFALADSNNQDSTALLMATLKNDSSEPFLPGYTHFFRDGVLVGSGESALILPGQEGEIALGSLPGMVTTQQNTFEVKDDSEVPVSENRQSSTRVLRVENLTGRDWPLVVRDRVPHAVHEDLTVTYSATPPETIRDKDSMWGILEWQTDIAQGATFEVVLQDSMRWPKGMMLQRQ